MNVMGVDLGIRKAHIFVLLDDDRVHVAGMDMGSDCELSRAYQLLTLGGYVREVMEFWGVDQVWIEDTIIGNNRKYSLQLTEVKGAVMAALALHADVRLVDNQVWKKAVVGHGNAGKDQVRDYIHVTHGAYAPLCEGNQDLYDACCIALYGRQIMERAKDIHLLTG